MVYNIPMQKKERRSQRIDVRISPSAKELLRRLTVRLGQSQSSVIELAIRRLAELERISSDSDSDTGQP